MTHLLQNALGRGRPDERLSVAVVMRHIVFDRANQVRHAAEGPPANPLARDLGEPALDQIEPRGTRRHEVAVIPGVGGEPRFHRGVCMGRVVVEDQMDLAVARRDGPVEFLQEGQEFGMAFPGRAPCQDAPIEHV